MQVVEKFKAHSGVDLLSFLRVEGDELWAMQHTYGAYTDSPLRYMKLRLDLVPKLGTLLDSKELETKVFWFEHSHDETLITEFAILDTPKVRELLSETYNLSDYGY